MKQTSSNSPLEAQSIYNKANEEASKGNVHEARSLYLELLDQNWTHPELQNNLASTYFLTGEYGFALKHLNQDLKQRRFHSETRKSIEEIQKLVPKKLGLKIKHPSEFVQSSASYLRPQESLFISSVFLALLLLSLFYKLKSKQFRIFCTVSLFFFLTCSAFLEFYKNSLGILTQKKELYSSPLSSSKVIKDLPSGTRFHILNYSGDFVEIERTKDFRGWVHKDSIYVL